MTPARRQFLQMMGAVAAAPAMSNVATAQAYPNKPIKLVLPFTAGSSNDVIARLIATPLTSQLGQPVVIDNRPGGGTLIGTKAVMDAEPNGYTFLVASSNVLVISQAFNENINYDPLKDLAPIASVASTSWVLLITPAVPAKSLPEFIRYAKANPGKLSFGFGQGTGPQLVGEIFKATTDIDVVGIPYKGGSQVVTDLLGGRLHFYFGTAATTLSMVESGKLSAIAVTSEARDPQFPDVPTMKESGFPGLTLSSTVGILGPAHTPATIADRIFRELREITNAPQLKNALTKVGYDTRVDSPRDFAALLTAERDIWLPIARKIGFKVNN